MRGPTAALAAVLWLAGLGGGTARAEEECRWGSTREINGHPFLRPTLLDSALIQTTFDLRLGGEYNRVPDVQVPDFGPSDFNTFTARGRLALSVRILDWLEVFGDGQTTVVTGTNVRTLLLDRTLAAAYSGEGGVALRLLRLSGAGTQLTFRAAVGGGTGEVVTVGNLVLNLRNAPGASLRDIFDSGVGNYLRSPVTVFDFRGALALAQPLSRAFSVQASADLRTERGTVSAYDATARDRVDQLTVEVTPSVGAAFTADAASVGVPLAFMAEYRFSHVRSQNHALDRTISGNSNDVALELFFSGRRDLQLGLVGLVGFGGSQSRTFDDETTLTDSTRSLGGEFLMAYFW
jgi:hypothetical protein